MGLVDFPIPYILGNHGFFFDPIAQTDAKAGSVAQIVLSSCWSCWSRTSPAFGAAADNSPWPRRFWNPSRRWGPRAR